MEEYLGRVMMTSVNNATVKNLLPFVEANFNWAACDARQFHERTMFNLPKEIMLFLLSTV